MTTALVDMLLRARAGEVTVPDLLQQLAASHVVVPSGQDATPDGAGLRPVLYEKDGAPMVACFSDLAGAQKLAGMAPHLVRMRGADLLRGMPAGHGLVVNPGLEAWFDLSPEGVVRAREAFAQGT